MSAYHLAKTESRKSRLQNKWNSNFSEISFDNCGLHFQVVIYIGWWEQSKFSSISNLQSWVNNNRKLKLKTYLPVYI